MQFVTARARGLVLLHDGGSGWFRRHLERGGLISLVLHIFQTISHRHPQITPLLGSVPILSPSPDMLRDTEQSMKCVCLGLAAQLMLA